MMHAACLHSMPYCKKQASFGNSSPYHEPFSIAMATHRRVSLCLLLWHSCQLIQSLYVDISHVFNTVLPAIRRSRTSWSYYSVHSIHSTSCAPV
ncbi:hypothetical protein ARMGADRAFT_545909 [Armillaria gallica]|uniref:Uncharacterized protein n=1 Tax=Armillaria gallica TaxID=47427 RepID=A0A2H3D9V7_ARMGA|nr:hypothetical protein ARMGADRAFT_545909 [Armillaria gallica]